MLGRRTFSKAIIKAAFYERDLIEGQNPSIWRRDFKNQVICFPSYGDPNSSYGWNIHHIDGNKENNKWSNLTAVHYDTHKELHK